MTRHVVFQAGGALTERHADVYIERDVEQELLQGLRRMDYYMIIEPRQQGKTSLVNYLVRRSPGSGMIFTYVDVTTPERATEADWYASFCPRLLRQLRRHIPSAMSLALPKNASEWRGFLSDLAYVLEQARLALVIVLDEIGAVSFPGSTSFFSVLRDIYNSRQVEPELDYLTFLLIGSFHPRNLIEDDAVSPFNIARRIRLPDFDSKQVRQLVEKANWSAASAAEVAARVFEWTDGQPYLTQLLCSCLGPESKAPAVDACVAQLRQDEQNFLPPMMQRLMDDASLLKYLERLLRGERIRFHPAGNRLQARLELLGVIKADTDGFCRVRNRLVAEMLAHVEHTPSSLPTAGQGIPGALTRRLIDVLTQCGPFRNPRELEALFVDSRIHTWKEGLPQADSTGGRVALVVDYLYDQYNARGESALVLFLRVMAEQVDVSTACYEQLKAVAEQVQATLVDGE